MDSATNRCKTSRMSFIDSEYTDDTVNPKVSCLESLHLSVSTLTYTRYETVLRWAKEMGLLAY